MQMYKTQLT